MKAKFKEIQEGDYKITIYQRTVLRSDRSFNLFTYTIEDQDENLIDDDEDVKSSYMNIAQCKEAAIEEINALGNCSSNSSSFGR